MMFDPPPEGPLPEGPPTVKLIYQHRHPGTDATPSNNVLPLSRGTKLQIPNQSEGSPVASDPYTRAEQGIPFGWAPPIPAKSLYVLFLQSFTGFPGIN